MSDSGVLDGITVVDFTMFLAGPYCSRLMADMGAEVLKIEPPAGDFLRNAPPMREGYSAQFGHFNCGKKSICVDLKHPEGLAAIKRLLSTADVLIENFRPGVMARLGLGYEAVKALAPGLVYCSVSGYGQTGPRAASPAFAPVIHAASGHELSVLRYAGDLERPVSNRSTAADIFAAIHAMAAINGALFHRERTGQGQHIDVALMDTMHVMLAYDYQEAQFPSDVLPPVFRPLITSDGFFVATPLTAQNFKSLATAIGRPELLDDARFSTPAARLTNWAALMVEVEIWTVEHTGAEAESRVLEAGCPCASYRTIGESMNDPQVVHRGSSVEIRDGAGVYRVPNCPFQYSDTVARAKPWVAELGEHTTSVLATAGYSDDEIRSLIQNGACRGGPDGAAR